MGRNVKQKVFGIGWGKTGTCTLALCLKRFGFRYAGFSSKFLKQVHQGIKDPAIAAVQTVDSVANFPWNILYKELDAAYPHSKFILTVRRDSKTWLKSMQVQEDRRVGRRAGVHKAGMRMLHDVKCVRGNEAKVALTYTRHNVAVEEYFDGRRVVDVGLKDASLLIACWETGTTFAELAAFLSLPCPRGKIPHIHWDESSGIQRPSIIGSLPPGT